jgi:hypothetical protein
VTGARGPLRVFLAPRPGISLGIQRVAQALTRHAPAGVVIMPRREQAELEILHVIGRGCVPAEPVFDREIAIIQYCFRTSETPTAAAWLPYWAAARLVWSYYDLAGVLRDELPPHVDGQAYETPRFLMQPLGVDAAFAAAGDAAPAFGRYAVGTSGFLAGDESVDAVAAACGARGLEMFHLGPDLGLGGHVTSMLGISDGCLARRWQECRYVSGLRRIEGFELPALEGLVCGTRPICFDAPHYRRWFCEHAEYIAEGDTPTILEGVGRVLDGPYRRVRAAEREHVRQRFDWPTLAARFWTELLDA